MSIVRDWVESSRKDSVKTGKDKQLDELVVTTNQVPFDANNTSLNYMSSVLAVANFKYNQAVASGTSATVAYDATYKTVISWRNADNSVSNVQLETVAEALEDAMNEIKLIKTGE